MTTYPAAYARLIRLANKDSGDASLYNGHRKERFERFARAETLIAEGIKDKIGQITDGILVVDQKLEEILLELDISESTLRHSYLPHIRQSAHLPYTFRFK
jgi:glycosylphosphatidylinositol transamidase (GPIT) subunit GPI8